MEWLAGKCLVWGEVLTLALTQLSYLQCYRVGTEWTSRLMQHVQMSCEYHTVWSCDLICCVFICMCSFVFVSSWRFDVICQCWELKVENRPYFGSLVSTIVRIMESSAGYLSFTDGSQTDNYESSSLKLEDKESKVWFIHSFRNFCDSHIF